MLPSSCAALRLDNSVGQVLCQIRGYLFWPVERIKGHEFKVFVFLIRQSDTPGSVCVDKPNLHHYLAVVRSRPGHVIKALHLVQQVLVVGRAPLMGRHGEEDAREADLLDKVGEAIQQPLPVELREAVAAHEHAQGDAELFVLLPTWEKKEKARVGGLVLLPTKKEKINGYISQKTTKVKQFLYLLKLMSKERKVDELLPKVEQSNGQKENGYKGDVNFLIFLVVLRTLLWRKLGALIVIKITLIINCKLSLYG